MLPGKPSFIQQRTVRRDALVSPDLDRKGPTVSVFFVDAIYGAKEGSLYSCLLFFLISGCQISSNDFFSITDVIL